MGGATNGLDFCFSVRPGSQYSVIISQYPYSHVWEGFDTMVLWSLCKLCVMCPRTLCCFVFQCMCMTGLVMALISQEFIKVFIPAVFSFQIMLKMYREEQGVEELLAADKLQSLIIAAASLWDQCSHPWKVPTGRVLRAISKTQTKNSILHLQGVLSLFGGFFPCGCPENEFSGN